MQKLTAIFKIPAFSIAINLLFALFLRLPLIGQMGLAHKLALNLEYRVQIGVMPPFKGGIEQTMLVANRWR